MSSNFKEQLKELLDSMDLTAEAGYSGECLSDEEVLSLAYERGDARTEHLAECQECSERLNFAKTQARLYERYKKAFLSEARGRSEKPVGLAYAFRPFWDALPRSKSWFAVPVL